jgi:UMF1 family MFS transporter
MFSMNVVSLYFGLWLVEDLGGSQLAFGATMSASMLAVALSMPIAGAIADRYRVRAPLVLFFSAVCGAATASMATVSDPTTALCLFAVALYSYQAALVFYNALLPDLAEKGRMGRLSGFGVALGYVGAIAGMLVVRQFVGSGEEFARRSAFLPTALLFLTFAAPHFLFVRDKGRDLSGFRFGIRDAFSKIRKSLSKAGREEGVLRFLVARYFVVDAMETVIPFMSIYAVKVVGFDQVRPFMLGFDEVTSILVLSTVFAVVGAFAWGRVVDRIGPRRALMLVLWAWLVALAAAVVSQSKLSFFVVGPLAGISLGGVWTSDRPLLSTLVPRERLAEYFGLYALSGRFAAVLGPLLWGLIVDVVFVRWPVTRYRIAVLSLALMIVAGMLVLRKVPVRDVRA